MTITRVLVIALVAIPILLSACGSAGADHKSRTLAVVGTEMAFAAPDSVVAGDYVVRFTNDGAMSHEVAVRDATGDVLRRIGAAPGQTATMELELEPGTYELGCFEPGHYQQGMKRLLTVRSGAAA